ncbi:zinc metalloprotease- variant [Apiospora phragmitis]|uniref:Zinc metalloprotease- variant n=1 Tax=Apiospora phragmitis TaxID=2905665 RepID=A0ABR1T330_9PEZI
MASPRFKKLQSFGVDYAKSTTITQYESERSGMRVVVVDRIGPKVYGYFTLATEIFDDSGAPHTLEHLVFTGSKTYAYKGLLDKLASRAYGYTNAWTAIDHTAYTLETAGWAGFAQTLPVYLEHLLRPTLKDEACLTEVHHIDGEGNDAGVVYSEMQALQNTSGELMNKKTRALLYPPGVGFRYETGGMMDPLRVLTPERIREFHKQMYTSKNLCLLIIGEVDHADLLKSLDTFETTIEDDFPSPNAPFKRPWVDSEQAPPIKETVVETVEFPEEDESSGDCVIAFFGPPFHDLISSTALDCLLTYLCGSSVSPTGVATEKLEFVEKRLHSLLAETASKPLDMTYMKECILRSKRQIRYYAESREDFYSDNIIQDFLFGNRDGSTLQEMKTLEEHDLIEAWTDEQWRAFMKKWMVDAPHISVLGKPSQKLADKLKEDETARIQKRKEELGADGLAEKKRLVEEAKKKNDVDIPASVLQQWPIPPAESIPFIQSLTARSGLARKVGVADNAAQKAIDNAEPGKPLFIQFESVPTNFVQVVLHVGTTDIPVKYKPLVSLFNDYFFNTPILRDGKRVDFEEVVMELEKDTIDYSIEFAHRYGDTESVVIKMQIEPENYSKAIDWLKTLMFDSVFDVTRLRATISKQLADIPYEKRDGRAMASEVEMAIHNEPTSLLVSKRALVKAVYLRRLKKLLEHEPDTVVSWFEALRKSLFQFANIRALVIADIEHGKLSQPVKAWDALTQMLEPAPLTNTPIVKPYSLLNEEGRQPGSVGAVLLPMTSIDSSFSVSTARGLTSWSDPAVPALLVAIQYLETVEGPLWNAVRGNGLAYGVFIAKEVDGGYIHFKTYRSPNAAKAITAAKDAISTLADGTVPFEKPMIEGAISQIISLQADEQATLWAAAAQNFVVGVVRGLEPDFNQKLLAKIRNVTEDQIRDAIKQFILPVFDPATSNVIVTCAPIMVKNLQTEFGAMGYKTQTKQLSDYYDAYGLQAREGEEEEDEDEDDEGSEDDDSDEDDD